MNNDNMTVCKNGEPRRRSTREIKRRKFDDEEFFDPESIRPHAKRVKQEKPEKQATVSTDLQSPEPPAPSAGQSPKVIATPPQVVETSTILSTSVGAPATTSTQDKVDKKKVVTVPKATGVKRGRPKERKPVPQTTPAEMDVGRWQPTDDLALITAVLQTNNLRSVYASVKFSCRFAFEEIQRRWYALMYDPSISKLAMDAMKELSPLVILQVQSQTLFSKTEEKILATIPSTNEGQLQVFERLIEQNPSAFHFARTAKVLQTHWRTMREYRLLNDQRIQPLPKVDWTLNFSEMEASLEDRALAEPTPDAEKEMKIQLQTLRSQQRSLDKDIPQMCAVVESVTGVCPPEFDSKTLAVLRGRCVRFKVKSDSVSLGRNTKDNRVDIDVSLDGPATKVSRRQAVIKMRSPGDFVILNEGQRPIFVDGRPVLTNCLTPLQHNSILELFCLRFTFLLNQAMFRRDSLPHPIVNGVSGPSAGLVSPASTVSS